MTLFVLSSSIVLATVVFAIGTFALVGALRSMTRTMRQYLQLLAIDLPPVESEAEASTSPPPPPPPRDEVFTERLQTDRARRLAAEGE